MRRVVQIWEKNGALIAEHDSAAKGINDLDMIDFVRFINTEKYNPTMVNKEMLDHWKRVRNKH